ncbi:MAG TPA: DUF1003 domain-containing protein [Geminicoccaceae bacterium]|nr:DUF1003 domain-containing protein [Geminicoccaceae bacterium]
MQRSVVESLARHETLSGDIESEFLSKLTVGERLADRIADFGGSWTFILSFAGFILVWVVINTVVLLARPFDPYPFILLNLFLSCLAAIQAPIIMMSQNRQEARDRLRAENDYRGGQANARPPRASGRARPSPASGAGCAQRPSSSGGSPRTCS